MMANYDINDVPSTPFLFNKIIASAVTPAPVIADASFVPVQELVEQSAVTTDMLKDYDMDLTPNKMKLKRRKGPGRMVYRAWRKIKDELHLAKLKPGTKLTQYAWFAVLVSHAPDISGILGWATKLGSQDPIMATVAGLVYLHFVDSQRYHKGSMDDYTELIAQTEVSHGESFVDELEVSSRHLHDLLVSEKQGTGKVGRILNDEFSGINYDPISKVIRISYAVDPEDSAAFEMFLQVESGKLQDRIINKSGSATSLLRDKGQIDSLLFQVGKRNVLPLAGKAMRSHAGRWLIELKKDIKLPGLIKGSPCPGRFPGAVIHNVEGKKILEINKWLRKSELTFIIEHLKQDKANTDRELIEKIKIAYKVTARNAVTEYLDVNWSEVLSPEDRMIQSEMITTVYAAPLYEVLNLAYSSIMQLYTSPILKRIVVHNDSQIRGFQAAAFGQGALAEHVVCRMNAMLELYEEDFGSLLMTGGKIDDIYRLRSHNLKELFFQLSDPYGRDSTYSNILKESVLDYYKADDIDRLMMFRYMQSLGIKGNLRLELKDGQTTLEGIHYKNKRLSLEETVADRKREIPLWEALKEIAQKMDNEQGTHLCPPDVQFKELVQMFQINIQKFIKDKDACAELINRLIIHRNLGDTEKEVRENKDKLARIIINRYALSPEQSYALVTRLVQDIDEIEARTEELISRDRGEYRFSRFGTQGYSVDAFMKIVEFTQVLLVTDLWKPSYTHMVPGDFDASLESTDTARRRKYKELFDGKSNGGIHSFMYELIEKSIRVMYSDSVMKEKREAAIKKSDKSRELYRRLVPLPFKGDKSRELDRGFVSLAFKGTLIDGFTKRFKKESDGEKSNKIAEAAKSAGDIFIQLKRKYFRNNQQMKETMEAIYSAPGNKLSLFQIHQKLWEEDFERFKDAVSENEELLKDLFKDDLAYVDIHDIIDSVCDALTDNYRWIMTSVRGEVMIHNEARANFAKLEGANLTGIDDNPEGPSLSDDQQERSKAIEQMRDTYLRLGRFTFAREQDKSIQEKAIYDELEKILRLIVNFKQGFGIGMKDAGGHITGHFSYEDVKEPLKGALKKVWGEDDEEGSYRDDPVIPLIKLIGDQVDIGGKTLMKDFGNRTISLMAYQDLLERFGNLDFDHTDVATERVDEMIDNLARYLTIESQLKESMIAFIRDTRGVSNEMAINHVNALFENGYVQESGEKVINPF